MIRPLSLLLFFPLLAPCLAGETSGSAAQKDRPSSAEANPLVLRLGMEGATVRGIIGRPTAVEAVPERGVNAEVWVYRRRLRTDNLPEATRTWDRPYFDVLANTWKTAPEPVYSDVIVNIDEVTHLLFVEGRLIHWKRLIERSRSYR